MYRSVSFCTFCMYVEDVIFLRKDYSLSNSIFDHPKSLKINLILHSNFGFLHNKRHKISMQRGGGGLDVHFSYIYFTYKNSYTRSYTRVGNYSRNRQGVGWMIKWQNALGFVVFSLRICGTSIDVENFLKGYCALVSSGNYTHVEILTGNNSEKFIDYKVLRQESNLRLCDGGALL